MKKTLLMAVCLVTFCIFDMAYDDFDEFEESEPNARDHGTRDRVQQKTGPLQIGVIPEM